MIHEAKIRYKFTGENMSTTSDCGNDDEARAKALELLKSWGVSRVYFGSVVLKSCMSVDTKDLETDPEEREGGSLTAAMRFADELATGLYEYHGIDPRCISHDERGGTVCVKIGDAKGVFLMNEQGAVAFTGLSVPGSNEEGAIDGVWLYMADYVDPSCVYWFH